LFLSSYNLCFLLAKSFVFFVLITRNQINWFVCLETILLNVKSLGIQTNLAIIYFLDIFCPETRNAKLEKGKIDQTQNAKAKVRVRLEASVI